MQWVIMIPDSRFLELHQDTITVFRMEKHHQLPMSTYPRLCCQSSNVLCFQVNDGSVDVVNLWKTSQYALKHRFSYIMTDLFKGFHSNPSFLRHKQMDDGTVIGYMWKTKKLEKHFRESRHQSYFANKQRHIDRQMLTHVTSLGRGNNIHCE